MYTHQGFVLFSLLLCIWALALAIDDIRQRRVLNVALLPVFVLAVIGRSLEGWSGSPQSLIPGLIGAAISLGFWLPGYLLKQSGAGDVKFAMVVGLILGPLRAVEANLLALLILGMYALPSAYIGRTETRIPAVPALAFGFIVELIYGPWLLGRGSGIWNSGL